MQVLDRDPNRAALMANRFVEILNERHIELSASSARENRLFLERRLTEAEAELDSVLAELQAFQEQSGVVEIEAQTDALMSAVADAQSQLARTEVEYEALRSLYGDENPDVQAAAAAVASARRQVAGLAGGDQSMMPVPIRQLPAVGRRYAELTVELTTQKAILEVVRPLYEQSVLTERQEVSAVQVLDPAIPANTEGRAPANDSRSWSGLRSRVPHHVPRAALDVAPPARLGRGGAASLRSELGAHVASHLYPLGGSLVLGRPSRRAGGDSCLGRVRCGAALGGTCLSGDARYWPRWRAANPNDASLAACYRGF